MNTTRYQITTAAGVTVCGYVQGAGGYLREENRGLALLRRMAARPESIGSRVYEPAPGCVAVDPSLHGDHAERMTLRRVVDLGGATVEIAAPVVSTYTTAPADYDGFGSATVAVVGRTGGRDVRHVQTPAEHADWQRQRYWSGAIYLVATPNQWDDAKRLGLAEPVKRCCKCGAPIWTAALAPSDSERCYDCGDGPLTELAAELVRSGVDPRDAMAIAVDGEREDRDACRRESEQR